jgi:hypothetical protein
MNHESRGGEILALGWHALWALVCLWCAANYIQASVESWPFAAIPGMLGFIWKRAYYGAVAQVFMATWGFLWHLYAIRAHVIALNEIGER